jgi:hypothetical protein
MCTWNRKNYRKPIAQKEKLKFLSIVALDDSCRSNRVVSRICLVAFVISFLMWDPQIRNLFHL